MTAISRMNQNQVTSFLVRMGVDRTSISSFDLATLRAMAYGVAIGKGLDPDNIPPATKTPEPPKAPEPIETPEPPKAPDPKPRVDTIVPPNPVIDAETGKALPKSVPTETQPTTKSGPRKWWQEIQEGRRKARRPESES